MKIGKIGAYVGAALLSTSCNVKQAPEKAMEHAAKYLKGSEFFVTEEQVRNIRTREYVDYSKDIFYWDSILSVNREKEFKQLGKQHVKDSAAGNYKRKPIFTIPMTPSTAQKGKNILDSIKKVVSKYYTGEEFLNLENNAPNTIHGSQKGTKDNFITHYYGTLAVKGAERKGFQDGLNEARKELKTK